MPKGRTERYAIWRACERLGLRPPGVKARFGDNDAMTQASIISYSQIREVEDAEMAGLSCM